MTNSYAFLGSQRDKAKRAHNVIEAAVDNRRQGKNAMRTMFKTAITATIAMVLIGMGFVSRANAQCGGSESLKHGGIQLQSFEEHLQVGTGSFLLVSSHQGSNNGIIGFWKVKFLSEGNAGIPDGTVLDNGFAQWHSDGTEIMNSSKPPVTSRFLPWRLSEKRTVQLSAESLCVGLRFFQQFHRSRSDSGKRHCRSRKTTNTRAPLRSTNSIRWETPSAMSRVTSRRRASQSIPRSGTCSERRRSVKTLAGADDSPKSPEKKTRAPSGFPDGARDNDRTTDLVTDCLS